MDGTLLNILLWVFVASAVLFPVVAMMAFLDLLGKATAKPKAPPHVYTPEEMAKRKAEALAMIAETESRRQLRADSRLADDWRQSATGGLR